MTALYLERYLNFGLTLDELQSGRPIIGIAQTGSDLSPCNRHHLDLASRVRDGIRDAGGIPLEFPVHPIQETGKRPTAALDRNLAYLGLVEVPARLPARRRRADHRLRQDHPGLPHGGRHGRIFPPSCCPAGRCSTGISAAACVGLRHHRLARAPADGGRATSTTTSSWRWLASSAPSVGHCNTMGTALSMNCLAEALGMSLPGCAAIPGPYRERGQMAYETGQRIVDMVLEDLRPPTS